VWIWVKEFKITHPVMMESDFKLLEADEQSLLACLLRGG